MKILLLEDNIALNRAIVKILKLDNHEVTSYINGQDVLENLTEKYDLYIFDINVPSIGGLELLELIHTNDKSSKVIITSANSDVDSLKKAYALGCMDYLNKPFHLEELRIKIARVNVSNKSDLSEIKLKNSNDAFTKKEKDFLLLLLENNTFVVSYKMIETGVYKNKPMSMDGLRALVKRLRLKLADDIIENVLEEGYLISL